MIDKWLALGLTVEQAGRFREIEDRMRAQGVWSFFSDVSLMLARKISADTLLRQYEVQRANSEDA